MSATMASMSIPTRRSLAARLPTRGAVLRRQCACGQHSPGGGQCQSCADKQRMVARMPTRPGSEGFAPPPIVHEALRSPGQALDAGTRQLLEPRFGQDFSGVRVHAGAHAAEAARAVNARAFTVGQNIVLGQGHSFAAAGGLELVAHELAHTIQQAGAPSGPIEVGPSDHPAEREAEQLSSAVLRGEPATATPDQKMQLRRDETDKPTPPPIIPAPKPLRPLIDAIDPSVTTPMGSGSLEQAHKAWDTTFGAGKSGAAAGLANCRGFDTFGFKPAGGSYKGQCCQGSVTNETTCCPPSRISVADKRCCTKSEALVGNHCVKREQPEPAGPKFEDLLKPSPTEKPPLQDAPQRILPPGQAYA